jgi:hypothetical protein
MKRPSLGESGEQGRESSGDSTYRAKLYRESRRLAHEGITSVTWAPPDVPARHAFTPDIKQRSTPRLEE